MGLVTLDTGKGNTNMGEGIGWDEGRKGGRINWNVFKAS